jgi:eukaryotic-like serine/threonine-protein kinase
MSNDRSSPEDPAAFGDTSQSSEHDSLLREVAHISERVAGAGAFAGGKLGPYVLGRKLGQGGMGEVYEATDVRLGRKVAIKVLPPSFASSGERRRRFLREAQAASAVSHPNLTVVYDVGEDGGVVFLAMELLSGRTLREALRAGPLGVAESLRVVRDVARGLQRAHAAGIVHRDLKPENVMVDADGLVKILDFGLAKMVRSVEGAAAGGHSTTEMVTAEGHVLGTPNYMSPEQAVGGQLDLRTDIFSLGVILYEMLSGRRPFSGTTSVEVLIRIARDEPVPLSQVMPEVPGELEGLVVRCLAKRPEDRFASCAELLAAIDALDVAPAPTPQAPRAPLRPPASSSPASSSPASSSPASSSPASSSPASSSPTSSSPTSSSPAGAQRRRAPIFAAGAALLGAFGAALWIGRGPAPQGAGGAASASASATLAPADVIACPPLAVTPASVGPWLGAAVAQFVCDRTTIALGGRYDRTLAPAELLGLPRSPTSAFPADPFNEPDARGRALAAARARAPRWIGGEVDASGSGYRVRLTLEGAAGVIAERAGSGADVLHAARAAASALAEVGALGARAEVDPAVADWRGAARVSELLAWQGVEEDENSGLLVPGASCDQVDRLAREAGPLGPLVGVECALVAEDPSLEPLPVDASTPGRLSRTARYHRVSGGAADPRALAADLRRALAAVTEPLGRAVLSAAEGEMWLFAGEPEKARERALVAVQSEPRAPGGWRTLMSASVGEPGFNAVVRAHAAWHPNEPRRWRWLVERSDASDADAKRLEYARRARLVAPHDALLAYALGEQLLRTGEREEVRTIAAELLAGGPEERSAGELLMISVDASLARFAAAYERGRRALESDRRLGGNWLRHELFDRTMSVAALLDRRAELADALVPRFVGPRPLFGRMGSTASIAATLCMSASKPLAGPCFDRVGRLIADKYFVAVVPSARAGVEGGKLYASGAYAKAAAAFRPLVSENAPTTNLMRDTIADAFDRTGDFAMAELVDRRAMDDAEAFHGATLAHVRAARRAAKRGDKAAARSLAAAVVRAWATADVPPPALREMRALAGAP